MAGTWYRKCYDAAGRILSLGAGQVAGNNNCCCCLCECDICESGTTPAWLKLKVVDHPVSPVTSGPWDGLEIVVYKNTHGRCCLCTASSYTCCDYDGVGYANGYGIYAHVAHDDSFTGGVKYHLLIQVRAIGTTPAQEIGQKVPVFTPATYGESKMDCGDWLGTITGELGLQHEDGAWHSYTIEIIQLGPMTDAVCCSSCQECALSMDYKITGYLCGCVPAPDVIDAADGTNVRINTNRDPRCKCTPFTSQFTASAECSYDTGTATYQADMTSYFVNEHGTLHAIGVLRMRVMDIYNTILAESYTIYEATISSECLPEADITLTQVDYRELDDPKGVLSACPTLTLTFVKVHTP